MDGEVVADAATDLPREPGVYQFRDLEPDEPRVLYVGKAVDLRDRVRSYADPRSRRIANMVAAADDVDVAVTDTETQALLLEANLIKRHQPRYNVRLTDDKSYPLVQLTDHEVPRIEVTRDPEPGATVFGPFTHRGEIEAVVKAIREVNGLRGCSDHKYASRERPCIDHEIGLCSAPCTGEISPAEYAEDVAAAERFFEGETGVLADPLQRRMDQAAENREFERAASLRDRLETVRSVHGDGSAAVAAAGGGAGGDGRVDSSGDDERGPLRMHVLGAAVEGRDPTVAVLESEGGKLVDRHRPPIEVPEHEREDARQDPASLLAAFVPQYYADRQLPDRLLLPEEPADPDVRTWLEDRAVEVEVPGAGREARLVDLALKNARRAGPGDEPTRALADALGIDAADRVEGFDVSHASGKATVGSNVVAVDGREHTDGYRRKKLPEGNDDPDRMRRLVTWRARRAVEGRDDRPDPDLLLIDGGDAQLAAAREALADVGWDVPVAAIAKEPDGDRILQAEESAASSAGSAEQVVRSRVREVDVPESALRLCQRVRDEAHRFAVQYHQTVRDTVSTVLDEIDGVGPATRERLLRRFGSVEAVREASREELEDVEGVGPATAETLQARL